MKNGLSETGEGPLHSSKGKQTVVRKRSQDVLEESVIIIKSKSNGKRGATLLRNLETMLLCQAVLYAAPAKLVKLLK